MLFSLDEISAPGIGHGDGEFCAVDRYWSRTSPRHELSFGRNGERTHIQVAIR